MKEVRIMSLCVRGKDRYNSRTIECSIKYDNDHSNIGRIIHIWLRRCEERVCRQQFRNKRHCKVFVLISQAF